MCLICVELASNKLTTLEARRNLGEMIHVIEEDHRIEVLQAIWKKEDEENKKNVPQEDEDDWFWGSD
jgi:hypothetical protein